MTRKHCILTVTLLAGLAGLPCPAPASVVLHGTRVIYPASQPGKTLHLTNGDAHPNLVQAWVARGEEDDTDGATNPTPNPAPFVVSPPIFRMAAHADQMVRLRLVGDDSLPADRESVFYLNFTQVPALPDDQQDANRLVVLLQSRVKLFYRPRGLPAHDLSCASLRLEHHGDAVQVTNISAYHVVVSRAEMVKNDAALPLASAQMLVPFAQTRWALPAQSDTTAPSSPVRLWLRNDYGADAAHTCPLA